MTKYRFQIQSSIDVEIESDGTVEEARTGLIDRIKDYADEMVTSACYVSDGVEVK